MATKAEFVQQIYAAALAAGLSDPAARVMAAQGGLESGYGQKAIGFNYFGVKGGNEWTGPVDVRPTKEGSGKDAKTVKQPFRVYDSPEAAIADRVQFMDGHFPGFNTAPDEATALKVLQNGKLGKYYTADPKMYEGTVKRIARDYLPASSSVATASTPTTVDHPVPKVDVPNAAPGQLQIVDMTSGGTIDGVRIPANPFAAKQRTDTIKGVVFHHTGPGSLTGAMTAGQNPGKQHGTSAQLYVAKDGTIYRYAPDTTASQQIRSSADKFRTDKGKPTEILSNDNTIGVEFNADDSEHLTEAQKATAAKIAAYYHQTAGVAPDMIVGHGEIQGGAGGNKMPTEGVPLASYARQYLVENPGLSAIEAATGGTPAAGRAPLDVSSYAAGAAPARQAAAQPAGFGDTGDAAMSVTHDLGWKNGKFDAASSTLRNVLTTPEREAAGRSAVLDNGLGVDDHLSMLLNPKVDLLDGLKQRASTITAKSAAAAKPGVAASASIAGVRPAPLPQVPISKPLPATAQTSVTPTRGTIKVAPTAEAVARPGVAAHLADAKVDLVDGLKARADAVVSASAKAQQSGSGTAAIAAKPKLVAPGAGAVAPTVAAQTLQDLHDARDAGTMKAMQSANAIKPAVVAPVIAPTVAPKTVMQPKPTINGPSVTVTAPTGGFDLGAMFNNAKQGAMDALGNAGTSVQSFAAEKAPGMAEAAKDAIINGLMSSVEARSAFLDPIMASVFTNHPATGGATRYGKTSEERQYQAAVRDATSQGLPTPPRAGFVPASAPRSSTTRNKVVAPVSARSPAPVMVNGRVGIASAPVGGGGQVTSAPVSAQQHQGSDDQRGQNALRASGMINSFGMIT